jgi:hypothetical protein
LVLTDAQIVDMRDSVEFLKGLEAEIRVKRQVLELILRSDANAKFQRLAIEDQNEKINRSVKL